MKVLSLFDGISCGRLALERAGLPVECYDAFEIDKYAVTVSKNNFPDILHHGDVFDGDFTKFKGYDLLLGGSPCFTKGHYVLTDKGYRDISEIKIGDMVLTHNGNYKPVVRTYQRTAETKKVNIVGFTKFTTTGNHLFYTIQRKKADYHEYTQTHSKRKFSKNPEWTKVDDMTLDTFCGKHTYIPEENFEIDDELLWILGRYIADGHLGSGKRKTGYYYQTVISVGTNKLDDFKKQVTKRHFSCYLHSQNVYRCVFSSKELYNLIVQNDFGRTAHEKKIPEKFMRLPIEKSKILLDGYLSGDGCFIPENGVYNCSTVSPVLALQIQRLVAHIYKTNAGLCVNKKLKERYIDGRKIHSNFPLYSVMFKKDNRKKSVYHVQNDIIWTPVKSVTPTNKTETVYNIEVADDNSYTVNNCIVHNCTYWSIAKKGRETTSDGMGFKLFMEYVRALKESECKYFLYENNYSIHKNIKAEISKHLGVEPIMINSALVSAQNRKRCYWTNIPNVTQPDDLGIMLADVLENGVPWQDKSYCMTSSYNGAVLYNTLERKQRTMVAMPVCVNSQSGNVSNPNLKQPSLCDRIYSIDAKNPALTTSFLPKIAIPVGAAQRGRYVDKGKTEQHIEIRNDGKSNCLTTVQKDTLVCSPVRIGQYGEGSQEQRIYSVRGKSVTLSTNGGGTGARTGLYKIDLPDGDYIIRKLTPIEAERLQTLPDNYTAGISNTQRYKCIGNGWTVDVIAHILGGITNEY